MILLITLFISMDLKHSVIKGQHYISYIAGRIRFVIVDSSLFVVTSFVCEAFLFSLGFVIFSYICILSCFAIILLMKREPLALLIVILLLCVLCLLICLS